MAIGFFKHILLLGVGYADSVLEKGRIVLFNYLIVFCFSVCLVLTIITSTLGLGHQALICLCGILFFGLALYFNHLGKISFSKSYFIWFAVLIISAGTISYLESGLFVQTENMLFAALAICMFLFDDWKRHIYFWTICAVLISLKVLVLDYQNAPFDISFIMVLVNNTVVVAVLYLFMYVFKSILITTLEKSGRHEQALNTLVDNVAIFMALVDKDQKFLLANHNYAERFGLTKEEIMGKKRSEVLPPHILDEHQAALERALKGEKVTFIGETELKNGKQISVNGQFVPIIGINGEVEAVTICIDDVTELVQAQKDLQSANETKDKLFSIIAHDIRSPLNLFQSILNVSHDDIISKEEFLMYQESVKEKLYSLTVTVDELLDWARMQLGGINAYPALVNVSTVINENADLFKSLIEKKKIDFSIHTTGDLIAWIDENHLKVVIRNLVHNALKYTRKGGKVKVEAVKADNQILISVSDNGVGMSAQKIESIINKELHKSEAGTDNESGTGLGLSLSIGLLEKNKCEIYVISELEKGTTVEIRMPVKAQDATK
jgi:PAS domain S-box-containing protein